MADLIRRGIAHVERRSWQDAYAVHLIAYHLDGDGRSVRYAMTNIEMEAVPDIMPPPDTPLVVSREMVQQFMDELWRAGVRPSEANHTTGELRATQAHLQEMSGMTQRLLTAVLEAG